jgi:methyl-accepting chemotaxis protein
MSPQQNKIHIEEEGFVTTKKGFTLSSMSLFIWILTGILFKLTLLFFSSIDYETFCFLVSLLLSGIAGYYLTSKLVKNVSGSSRLLLAVANILLLYTSANGIQSGYCFISQPSQNENVQNSSFIPFMVAKPWLPDKFQFSIIQDLEEENKILEKKVIDLQSADPDNSDLINEIEKLREANQIMTDSINNFQPLLEDISDCSQIQRELEVLQLENQRLLNVNRELQAKLSSCSRGSERLNAVINELREKCSPLRDRIERLTERINEYNSLQQQWRNQIKENDEFKSFVNEITNFVGRDFYQKLFNTPISID